MTLFLVVGFCAGLVVGYIVCVCIDASEYGKLLAENRKLDGRYMEAVHAMTVMADHGLDVRRKADTGD